MTTFRLEGERLSLRPLRPVDAPVVAAYRNHPDVARYQSWPLPYSTEDAALLIADMAGRVPGEPGWVQIGLESRTTGTLLGDVAINTRNREAELGVTLSVAAQGKGYAAEAMRVLIGHAFGPLGLERVVAEIDPRNVAVQRLLLGLGFRHLETQVGSYLHRGEWTDTAVYALRGKEWTT